MGSGYIFHSEWSHIIKVQWATMKALHYETKQLPCRMHQLPTLSNTNYLMYKKSVRIPSNDTSFEETVYKLCVRLNEGLEKLSRSINGLYNDIAAEVKNTQISRHKRYVKENSSRNRTKREILPFVSTILKQLFGVGTEKSEQKISREVEKLMMMINTQRNATVTIEKGLIRMSELADSRHKKKNNAMSLLGSHVAHVENQADIIRKIDKLYLYFHHSIQVQFNMLEAAISSLSSIYDVKIFANAFHSRETSLIQLRSGFLPLNIVYWPY